MWWPFGVGRSVSYRSKSLVRRSAPRPTSRDSSDRWRRTMGRSDDTLDKIDDRSDQLEAKILKDGAQDQAYTVVSALGLGWAPGRSRTSSFTSNLSTIAASAKLISGIGVVAILYFGREVFVPLAVAILLT